MYFTKRNTFFNSACKFIRLYSSGRKTHYEVLNLQRNCTDKEIKDAFIQMSKEYHPDKNKSVKAQENFVKIVEAYNVLGKPSTRAQYDRTTEIPSNDGYTYVYKTHVPYNWRNNSYNAGANTHQNTKSNSYYGVKGLKKMPNFAIIIICFGVAMIGVIIQAVVIKESYRVHRKQIEMKSIKIADDLEKVRENARGKTRDMQTQGILDKIVTASNPSVATASLGQSLADEKK